MKNTGSNKKVLGRTAFSIKLVTPLFLTVLAMALLIAWLSVHNDIKGMYLLFGVVCAAVSLPFWFLPINTVVYDENKQILILRGCGQNFTSLFKKTTIPFSAVTGADFVPRNKGVNAYGGIARTSGLHILAGERSLACLPFTEKPQTVAQKINALLQSMGRIPNKSEEPVRFTDEQIEAMYSEVGIVTYVDTGIKFKAGGKFAVEKDFNGKKGYHLAFTIVSEGLHYMPEDYDDVCDYGGAGFTIDIGILKIIPLPKRTKMALS